MIKKTKLALAITAATLSITVSLVSQQAVAGTVAQHHAQVSAMESKVDALEAQLRAMQDEMAAMRASAGQGGDSAKVQELDAWMQEHKSRPEKVVHESDAKLTYKLVPFDFPSFIEKRNERFFV